MKWMMPEPVEPYPEPMLPGHQPLRRRHGALVPVYHLDVLPSLAHESPARPIIHHMQFTMTPWAVRNSPKWWW